MSSYASLLVIGECLEKMHIELIELANYRKLKSVRVEMADETTVFVGANNSGKTSAMLALRHFLVERERSRLSLNDFTLSLLGGT